MRATTLVLTLSLCGLPLAAQQGDRGVFAIQRGRPPAGRSSLRRPKRARERQRPRVARPAPATAPTVQIQAMVEESLGRRGHRCRSTPGRRAGSAASTARP
jgi:hypothetical protein